MNQKVGRIFAVLVTVAIAGFGYTNCAQPLEEASNDSQSLDPSSVQAGMPAEKITLQGYGTSRNWASGCKAGNYTDWMETMSSDHKRLEPRDCAKVSVATPVFAWSQPRDLMPGTSYTLHVYGAASTYDFSIFPPRTRALMKTMPAGQYKWTVTYKNTAGAYITSSPRLFEVPAGTLFSIPNGTQFANAVMAKSHPRIQPNEGTNPANKVSWATIRTRARDRGYTAAFDYFFLTQLNTSYGWTLPTLPTTRNKMLDLKTAIVNMAYGYNFTGDVNYFRKSALLLSEIVKWPLDCGTAPACDDQINREIHSILAVSLDLFQWKLSEDANIPLRNAMVTALLKRLDLVDFNSFNTFPYDSHLVTNTIYSIESMMYAAGTPGIDGDAAKSRLAYLWENAVTSVGLWGGNLDAGWANSVGYGWYAADTYVRLMAVSKLMANIDLSPWPALANMGFNQVYFTAPLDSIREPFGDETDVMTHYKIYSGDTFRLYALLTGKPEYEWYWRVRGDANVNNKFMWNPLHFMVVASTATPRTFPAFSAANMPRSTIFDDAGLVAMHSDMSRADRSSVYFRSSGFGSFNHSHADNNAFTFVSKGKDILISAGVYDDYDTAYHDKITRATRYKNALTFNGGIGQAEPSENPLVPGAPHKNLLDFKGQIIGFQDDGTWAVATGNATDAYRGMDLNIGRAVRLLTGAYRTVAYNRSLGLVFIYDSAQSATPRKWELNFHTLKSNSLAVNTSNKTFSIANSTTSACFKIWTQTAYGFEPVKEGWEGLSPKTLDRPIYPELHLRASASGYTSSFAAVTVINEGCKSTSINVTWNGVAASAYVNGIKAIDFNGKTATTP